MRREDRGVELGTCHGDVNKHGESGVWVGVGVTPKQEGSFKNDKLASALLGFAARIPVERW